MSATDFFKKSQSVEPVNPVSDLDPVGEMYKNTNPPDGVADGVKIRIEPPKRAIKFEGKSLSSLRAAELRTAIDTIRERLTNAQRQSLNDDVFPQGTAKQNRERLKLMIKAEMEEPVSQSSFWDLVKSKPEPKLEPDFNDQRLLLVDCSTEEAVHVERCLETLILEIEKNYKQHISLIPYNEGWKTLASLIAERGWIRSGLGHMVIVNSSSPIWTNASHVLIPLSTRIIKGN